MTLLAGAAVEYTDTDEKEFVANFGFVIITDTTECLLLDGKDSMYPSVKQGFRAATVVDDTFAIVGYDENDNEIILTGCEYDENYEEGC